MARHKLADHWRRAGRDERLGEQDSTRVGPDKTTRGTTALDPTSPPARCSEGCGTEHQNVLTFRYLDALPVPDVPRQLIGRSVSHATESLLVRARAAFRRIYGQGEEGSR